MDGVYDPGRIVVQGQSAVHSEMLHEGELAKGETQWRISRTLWSRQDVHKIERFIFLVGNASRRQEIRGQMQNLPAFEGKKTECGILSTIAHTREAVVCNQHGFCIGVAKNIKRL
jgi:hypothetical protein